MKSLVQNSKVYFQLLGEFWLRSEKRKRAYILVLLIVSMYILSTYINVELAKTRGNFMTYLSKKEVENFYLTIFYFFGILFSYLLLYTLSLYLQDRLVITWREGMTKSYLNSYLSNSRFYHINRDKNIDNPDQRISEDILSFINNSIKIFFSFLDSILQFFAYSFLLYSISGLLFFTALLLSIVTNFLGTYLFGRRLSFLNFEQYKKEADLRFDLMRVREHSESIALWRGDKFENKRTQNKLKLILENSKKLVFIKANLNFFQVGSKNLINTIPTLLLAGMYLNGEIEFGIIETGGIAFVSIMYSLNIINDQLKEITLVFADMKRISELDKVSDHDPDENILHKKSDRFLIQDLSIIHPGSNQYLIKNLMLNLDNKNLWISGISGIGKSTFLKTIFGFYHSTGTIQIPENKKIGFLPQNEYQFKGNLIDLLMYPENNNEYNEKEIIDLLDMFQLNHLKDLKSELDSPESSLRVNSRD